MNLIRQLIHPLRKRKFRADYFARKLPSVQLATVIAWFPSFAFVECPSSAVST
jgi:hypothetical protein